MRNLFFVCLLSISCVALAEEAVVDAPGRVARLSLIEGDVSLAPAGTEEWAEAILNRPLTSGDRLFVDNGGRAELQVGSARIHLDQNSGLSIIDLGDDVMHLELSEGTAVVRVLRRRDSETIEVETPNATVSLLHPGEYRIEANAAGDVTTVATRSGSSDVIGQVQTWRVDAGNEGTFRGTNQLSASIGELGPRTAFEDWANDRDRVSENPVSARYVSNEVIGYEDLDRHGRWISEPAYGYVWQPTYVAAGWAPYRYGRWVWVSPWGWSWVDNSPWGFAPFHYGRWAYLRSRWCWVPGPRYIRPVYAPALVAWAGSPGISVSIGIGAGVGWFPLGPREIYVPGYRYSRRYLNNVNVSNTVIVNNTIITNVYNGRHRNFDYRYGSDPHAVTVVDRDRFRGGRNLDGQWTRVSEPDLRRWHHDPRPPALVPNRDSVFAARTLGRIPGGADHVVRQTFAQHNGTTHDSNGNAARPVRISFDAERRAIEANGGRPIARSQLNANAIRNAAVTSNTSHARGNGEGPREQQWRTDRERGGGVTTAEAPRTTGRDEATQQDRTPQQAARARAAAGDAQDRPRSDRPSWSQRETPSAQTQRPAPVPVNSLQQQSRNGQSGSITSGSTTSGSTTSGSIVPRRETTQQRGGSDWQDRGNRGSQRQPPISTPSSQSLQPRSAQSSGQPPPYQRTVQPSSPPSRYEQRAIRTQPAVQSQPRVEQSQSSQAGSGRSGQPQSGNNNSDSNNSRGNRGSSHSGSGRPSYRQQER